VSIIRLWCAAPLLTILAAWSPPARAAEPLSLSLSLKDHRFVPAELTVPSGVRFRIQVLNQDDTPAEFESNDLRVEKIAAPGVSITVIAGPLKPGVYKFFDDYHPDVATGTLTAIAPKE
jgi:heme/copper-type cytochrome/quinol oxidase subunit 2